MRRPVALLMIRDGSRITSESTGNLPAGGIQLNVARSLLADSGSAITTTANTGDGGAITIRGPESTVRLRDSSITTSVLAGAGNGGDIGVTAKNLVLDSGRIEANAASGRGGEIELAVQALLPSANTLNGRPFTGADALLPGPRNVRPNNVIQAVSANGVSGTIRLTAPQLNLSGALANVGNPGFDTSRVQPERCEANSDSGLVVEGRGALPLKGDDLLVY